MEPLPESGQAGAYRDLSREVIGNETLAIPTATEDKALEQMYYRIMYADT